MPQSLSKILIHAVFSTKDRRPLLQDSALRTEMHRYLGGILNQLDCQALTIGGADDHVHALFCLPRTRSVADAIKELKRGSSLWVKERYPGVQSFAWQSGYGAFSIGFSQLEAVRQYIAGQEEHHKRHSFQDELREFLKRYQVAYDERYIWD
jgi:REP element-mobilizing transposase RayT